MEASETVDFRLVEARGLRNLRRMQQIFDSRLNLDTKAKFRAFRKQALAIDQLRANFEQAVDESNRLQAEADPKFVPNYQALDAFEDMYYEVKDLLQTTETDQAAAVGPSSAKSDARPRLPKVDMMDFDGDPLKWPLFSATFQHLIHENPTLDPVSKMHYLMGKLKGAALVVCAGMIPTAKNYKVLWDKLLRKYDDKRALAGAYLDQILDFKPLSQENVTQLGQLIERMDSAVKSLFQLEIDNLADYVVTTICLSKVDAETRILFERSLKKDEFPCFDAFSNFVREQCRIMERSVRHPGKPGARSGKTLPLKSFAVSEKSSVKPHNRNGCEFCGSSFHRIHKCYKFLALSQPERKKAAFKHSLCFNCLKSGHSGASCPSSFSCSHCKQNHHTLLHSDDPEKERSTTENAAVTCVSTLETPKVRETVLLSTATVLAYSRSGEKIRMRVLIDSASQCNFITSQLCQKLNLQMTPIATAVAGIGAAVKTVQGQVSISFRSRFQPCEYRMRAWVIDRITEDLPSVEVDRRIYALLDGQQLADDSLSSPGAVDGMIGAELVPIFLGPGRSLGPGWPMVMESPLGLIVMGKAPIRSMAGELHSYCCTNLNDLVQKFWDMDSLEERKAEDPKDLECERVFTESIKRGLDGRYTVALPFENYPPDLGRSYEMALRRFLCLEAKFSRSPDYGAMYGEVMRDYINQGHMKLADPSSTGPNYYIPHHGIVKTTSTSTPLRVVFDASAPSLNGRSLNDTMFVGPKLQTELFDLLIRFRTFKVAMTADVRQMYRQIWVSQEHQPFQRVLWRFKREEPIRTYELTTVTFGVKASPFLALRTVQQLAVDEAKRFPLAAERVARELYMDDVVSSVAEVSEALQLYQQWVGLFKAGGFQLVKWATNSADLLKHIPQEARRGGMVDFPTDMLTVLGLQWNPEEDELAFKVDVKDISWSKRSVLSTMARIWDPLGLLAPVTVSVKLLMKRLWSLKVGWDDPLPPEILKLWQNFVEELQDLGDFRVSRNLGIRLNTRLVLVGFADASEKAYAAAIYLVMEDDGRSRRSRLLCSKSKVAPMKAISIPRLELCGALLLAKLMRSVMRIYEGTLSFSATYAFSDSTVVLHWLRGSPHRWKTFVANRVTTIKEYLPHTPWGHVRGEENPTDCGSRGLSPRKFMLNNLWLEGPDWLTGPPEEWPKDSPELEAEVDLEEQPVRCLAAVVQESTIERLIERCSSWSKLLRITVFVLRFGGKLPRGEGVKTADFNVAEEILIRFIQRAHFPSLINDLQSGKTVGKSWRVLTPFLKDGIVRVGGRLQNSTLSYAQQHPILLPKGGNFVHMLIDYLHIKYLHAGPTLLAALLRQRYWVLGARNVIRHRLHLCNRCFKCRPTMKSPVMADLPVPRVSEVKPFSHTGIDFAGPFKISLSRRRGAKTTKGYLCLFICLSTRAVHLEGASDLSTDICLAAIKRFLARRGPCSVFYSDQGTNFVGAKRYLDELGQFLRSPNFQHRLQQECAEQRIEWKLNPPAAPHFGGSWEAGVKSVKYHLTRVVGEQILTFEEFATVLCEIEAVLNSRPLCWLSTDPADPIALTPAHFLTLTPLQSIPAPQIQTPLNRLQRRELIEKIVQDYWSRWRLEYLTTLQKRMKWNTPICPIEPGLLVVVHQDHVPPLRWPLGRVQEIYPGPDGVVRVALVKTQSGLFKRPVHKLAPLPNQ